MRGAHQGSRKNWRLDGQVPEARPCSVPMPATILITRDIANRSTRVEKQPVVERESAYYLETSSR